MLWGLYLNNQGHTEEKHRGRMEVYQKLTVESTLGGVKYLSEAKSIKVNPFSFVTSMQQ